MNEWIADLDKKYLVLSVHTKPMDLYVNATIVLDLVSKCNEELIKVRKQRDEAQTNYQFMVDRVCDEKLDGYRELAAKIAHVENERDELQKKIDNYIT
jgi:uncharacterized coiled-coil DUF342 family protein